MFVWVDTLLRFYTQFLGYRKGQCLGRCRFSNVQNDLPLESGEATAEIYADGTTITAAADQSTEIFRTKLDSELGYGIYY